MLGILSKLFAHKGIKDIDELSPEERATFEGYERVLSKRELTVEDIKVFLVQQIGVIEAKWMDLDAPTAKKAELIPHHTVYKALLGAITSPQREAENLEHILMQQLK